MTATIYASKAKKKSFVSLRVDRLAKPPVVVHCRDASLCRRLYQSLAMVVWNVGEKFGRTKMSRLNLKRDALWSGAIIVVLLGGLVISSLVKGVEPNPSEFWAVASKNQSAVEMDSVSCLSVDSHDVVFDRKDYSDPRLIEAIVGQLQIKIVLFDVDYATCPWGFFVTVVPGQVSAVKYQDLFAQYLVSIGVCERSPNGRMNPNRCTDKNVYVFNPHVEPHELFTLALIGLAKSHMDEWEVFKVRKSL